MKTGEGSRRFRHRATADFSNLLGASRIVQNSIGFEGPLENPRRSARFWAAAGLATLLALRVFAAGSGIGLFAPQPSFAALGVKPEPLKLADLERAAFLASGLSGKKLDLYVSRLNLYLRQLRAEDGSIADPYARGEAVLSFIHGRILRDYQSDATTLDGVLDTGTFNCVSSAILYMIAGRSLGLDIQAVRTPDHAFCVVRLPERNVDVETTTPEGFDPGTKRAFTDSFGKVTGFAYVPPGDYSRRTMIDDKQLVGLILSNRAVSYEAAGDYVASFRIAVDYYALERDAATRSFLIDRVNNLCSTLVQRGDYAEAENLVTEARVTLGEDPKLTELEGTVAYMGAAADTKASRWDEALDEATRLRAEGVAAPQLDSLVEAALSGQVFDLVKKRDYAGARNAIEARRQLAGAALAASLLEKVGEAELADTIGGLPFREALSAADRELTAGNVSISTWKQAVGTLYYNEANRVARTGDWLLASQIAAEGLSRIPEDANLAKAVSVYRSNFVTTEHNRFAALYNVHDFAAARNSIRAALARLPGDRTLLADLALVDRALAAGN